MADAYSHSHVLNEDYDKSDNLRVTNAASRTFISRILKEQADGSGFVPFIGAGLSAPSGVPLIWELKSYLQRCIGLALGVEEIGMTSWNPRTDQWPPFNDRGRSQITNWLDRVRNEFERRKSLDEWAPEVPVFQEAMGAMAEWRTALLFLSRLVRERRSVGWQSRDFVALDAPAQEVIDACIKEMMRGKHPTMGHRMLAMLAGVLRLDIVVTTNFDDLLERAFAAARNPLTPYNIELNGQLPSASTLSRHRSIVKLHGSGHSLRADYTLDALPSEQDRWRFVEYLLTADGRDRMAEELRHGKEIRNLPFKNHLLVMGFSVKERRTRALIEHAFRCLPPDFKVFWLCHTSEDVKTIREFTEECLEGRQIDKAKPRQSLVLRHTDLGLFFLQLFQTMRLSLPPRGIIFPSPSRLSIPPLATSDISSNPSILDTQSQSIPEPRDLNNLTQARSQIQNVISNTEYAAAEAVIRKEIHARIGRFQEPGFSRHKLIVVTSPSHIRGVTSVCARTFDDLDGKSVRLWLDMNDIANPADLFEKLLDAAYFQLGREHWLPVHVTEESRKRAAEINRLAASTSLPWVIFLNARETPGANVTSPEDLLIRGYPPNAWVDGAGTNGMTDQLQLLALLSDLCGPLSPRVSIVLICRCPDSPKLTSTLVSPLSTERELKNHPVSIIRVLGEYGLISDVLNIETPVVPFDEHQTIVKVLNWTCEGDHKIWPAKRQFLHGLILLQRTRYLATVWCDALRPAPTDLDRQATWESEHALTWLDELEKLGLVRFKVGGFIWIHARSRTHLRHILRAPNAEESKKRIDEMVNQRSALSSQEVPNLSSNCFVGWNPLGTEPELQSQLASWYDSVLAASDAPAALFEAIYHACRSAHAWLLLRESANSACEQARRQLEWASSKLRAFGFLAQTQGYSRGSCRSLEFIRDQCCKDIQAVSPRDDALLKSIRTLRLRCTELMRAIAREVGEFRTAYERHQHLWGLLLNQEQGPSESVNERTEQLYDAWFASEQISEDTFNYCGEWLRWCRWGTTLAMESRQYENAYSSAIRGIRSLTHSDPQTRRDALFIPKDPNGGKVRTLEDLLVEFTNAAKDARCVNHICGQEIHICGRLCSDPQQIRIETVRLIEQAVSCGLLGLNLLRRQDALLKQLHVQQLQEVIAFARKIIECIIVSDHVAHGQSFFDAKWCDSRLLLHQSTCAMLEAQFCGLRNGWQVAMKCLIEAESCLAFTDPLRSGTDLALVELFRAEVKLREADALAITDKSETFGVFRARLRSSCVELEDSPYRSGTKADKKTAPDKKAAPCWWRDLAIQIRNSNFDSASRTRSSLQGAKSLVQDAWRFLERAETILQGRRRNVWWTTWLFERSLTAIAMSVWATLPETGTSIPFLGLEYAPRQTDTIADQMLADAIRMVRIDLYRLATIVQAYGDCAYALRLRLMCDSDRDLIPYRQLQMATNLQQAIRQLRSLSAKSNSRSEKDWEISKEVTTFVNKVIDETETLLRILDTPIG